jgi:AbrB family looped-hinge helix DNA binding protein
MVLQIRRNFQITLPASLRKRLHLSIGDILETEIKAGKIIIKPKKAIDAEQVWFWSKEWQEAEKEAEADLKEGRVKKFKNVEDLIKDLDK